LALGGAYPARRFWASINVPALTPAKALFPLRLFLGLTFVYAGVQKLADPGFLKEGSTTYIGSQLDGFAQGSPIGPLLHLANHAPELTGVATAVNGTAAGRGVDAMAATGAGSSSGAAVANAGTSGTCHVGRIQESGATARAPVRPHAQTAWRRAADRIALEVRSESET